ncbi:hypothetical protein [Pararobbsia silviterrae]|uniref:hypothetical protein n=1 Tax=Pararobbsia silviterrae TaxID=1792498 RepID=UPI0013149BFC|nr:hypothetical protein [Pararobbsia silviterrae]
MGLLVAPAAGWSEPPEYAIQYDGSVQYANNPAGLPESLANQIEGATAIVNTLGVGLRWPFASDATRLDLSGSASNVRYSNNTQLDHNPDSVNATFYWRATPLFVGNLHYDRTDELSPYINQVWPESDIQRTQNASAQFGLRVTDAWELPIVQVFHGTVNYDAFANHELYAYDQNGWQISARYAPDPSGIDNSALEFGVRHTAVDYPWRLPDQVSILDNAYADSEVFSRVQWDISSKTWVELRTGFLRRDYANLTGRDINLFTVDLHTIYHFSPKVLVDLDAWRRPYADATDPTIIYSVQTGGLVTVAWQATPKTSLAVFYTNTLQKNTSAAGVSNDDLTLPGYGVRFQWQPSDNQRWVLDFVSSRQQGLYAFDNYYQRYVRLGFEYAFGSHDQQGVREMMKPNVCDEQHPALLIC